MGFDDVIAAFGCLCLLVLAVLCLCFVCALAAFWLEAGSGFQLRGWSTGFSLYDRRYSLFFIELASPTGYYLTIFLLGSEFALSETSAPHIRHKYILCSQWRRSSLT